MVFILMFIFSQDTVIRVRFVRNSSLTKEILQETLFCHSGSQKGVLKSYWKCRLRQVAGS